MQDGHDANCNRREFMRMGMAGLAAASLGVLVETEEALAQVERFGKLPNP